MLLIVWTSIDYAGGCGYHFEIGKYYFVYAYQSWR